MSEAGKEIQRIRGKGSERKRINRLTDRHGLIDRQTDRQTENSENV